MDRSPCSTAIAHSTYLYLDYLQLDTLQKIANEYAALSRRWDLYIERGYSMTLIERLGGSAARADSGR